MIRHSVNYGQKHYHGVQFGLSQFRTKNDWQIRTPYYGGNCVELGDDQHAERMLMFGNCWIKSKTWRHPDTLKGRWFYFDNPQLPHLLYQGYHNEKGYKNWCRIVEGNTATTTETPVRPSQSGSARINSQLEESSRGSIRSWRQLVGQRRDALLSRSRTVLLCPPSDGVFRHYYETTTSLWTEKWRRCLELRGYTVELRPKPARQRREEHNNRLYQILERNDIAFTVSIHSVSAVESILAGVPAVVEGRHPAGHLGTTAERFINENTINQPTVAEQDIWVERLLMDTYHKTEAYSGEWY